MAIDPGIIGSDGLIRSRWWRNGALGFKPFSWGTWQPVIPSLYWEAIGPEQQIHDLFCYVESLVDYSNRQTEQIAHDGADIAELRALFEQFKASGFDDYYKDQIIKWIDSHLKYIYDHTIKHISFRLDDTGRLIALVPDSWDDITFSTPLDPNSPYYGCLVLEYNV